MKRSMNARKILVACLMLATLSACRWPLNGTFYVKHSDPNFVYAPDMHYTPAVRAQEEGALRLPVKGTIPRGKRLTYLGADALETGRLLKNPLPRSRAVLKRGQERYTIYCIVCHGPLGEGNGNVVPKFATPPTLQSDKIRGYADGSIFHVITAGQNRMGSYASQVSEDDRWAIVHYIRVLHRAKSPTAEDLKKAEGK